MFSIIGGRIRCEMGKSGYECYRQTALLHSPHLGVSTVSPHLGTNILQRAEGGVDFEVARVACFLRSGRRLDRCRQQMGEIENQEQTIGDSGDDWRRRRSL